MLHFDSDYMEGAHPAIIERLAATNLDQTSGYGTDEVCAARPPAHPGGVRVPSRRPCTSWWEARRRTPRWPTRSSRPWEGIVSATTGHITAHEAGAVEACGRKTLPLPQHDGKLDAAEVRALLRGVLGRREPRAHRGAGRGVYLASYRVRHRVLAASSSRRSRRCAATSACGCSWTARAWATAWPPWEPMSRCPTSRVCATRSTSAARRWARCAARPWCSRSRGSTTTSSRS